MATSKKNGLKKAASIRTDAQSLLKEKPSRCLQLALDAVSKIGKKKNGKS